MRVIHKLKLVMAIYILINLIFLCIYFEILFNETKIITQFVNKNTYISNQNT